MPMPGWYGGQERTVEIVSRTAVWYHGGKHNARPNTQLT